MRFAFKGFCATMTILPCLCLLAAGQGNGVQPTAFKVRTQNEAMRHTADMNAKAFASFATAHAVKSGKYENVMTDYAKDFGGKIPINPCTGTRTGYAMVVFNGRQEAMVAASAGNNCGKWVPKVYRLTLKQAHKGRR